MNEYSGFPANTVIPAWMRIILVFIDRVGFPILAFCLMFFLYYQTTDSNAKLTTEITAAIKANTSALVELSASSKEFQRNVSLEHKQHQAELHQMAIRINNRGHS